MYIDTSIKLLKRNATPREKDSNTEFFLNRIFSIRAEYGDILRKYTYSVRIRENTDQKKLCIWTLFTQ